MRATFITTALENGAQLEDVQSAAGHRDPSTTKLYDRRGYNPEKRRASLLHYWKTPFYSANAYATGDLSCEFAVMPSNLD
jgi:hypothetical protein